MSNSTNLGLPYLEAAQAQKHVTVNEALTRLDALVHLAVISRVVATPPVAPALGDRYLLPVSPAGVWATQGGKLAMWLDGAWNYAMPREGWQLWVSDENVALSYDGAAWVAGGVPTSLQNMQVVGINASADVTNKLVVASAATLFNHAGAGHQMKFNKNAATDTASLLWQTGFSGRAEIGTTGDDDFHLKVSGDGAAWLEALTVNRNTGVVSLPQGVSAFQNFGATEKGMVPASGGGTVNYLRADGAWTAPPVGSAGLVSYKTSTGRWLTNSLDTTTLTTTAGAAGRMEIAPWSCPFDMAADQVGVLCSTAVAAAQAKIVCYNSDTDGRPNSLLFETAVLDLSTTGFKSLTQALSFVRGGLYWLGLRYSSSAAVNAHQPYNSPVLGFASPPTSAVNKVLRRVLTFATAAPTPWAWSATEETPGNVPAIFLRLM
jgi:Protein of unknown function (DUF2793)